jgi:hypothetical protein
MNDENVNPNQLMEVYEPLRSKKPLLKVQKLKDSDKLREKMPYELQLIMTFFLSSRDIVVVLGSLSQYWRRYAKDLKLWVMIEKTRHLSINERLQILQCLVERRSKGKLYKAQDRVTGDLVLLRKIYLDITNAGQDDGLPTSVLREISHLKSIRHPNVGRVRQAEVRSELALVVYEY